MVGIIEASNSIREFLKERVSHMGDEEITYVDGYLKTKSYEEKLKTGDKGGFDSEIPFILIRPGKQKQEIQNGNTKKLFKLKLRIVTKNPSESGYEEITELAGQVIKQFTMFPSLKGGFILDMSEIKGGIEDDLCVGDYWTYIIELDVELPVVKARILETLGYL